MKNTFFVTPASRFAFSNFRSEFIVSDMPSPSMESLRRTDLHDYHVKRGGKMINFIGWSMPDEYTDLSPNDSCVHTRSYASLFDVSHLRQFRIYGVDREAFIESLVVSDIKGMKEGKICLTLLTTDSGMILDDTILIKFPDYLRLDLSPDTSDNDLRHMEAALHNFNDVRIVSDRTDSLIALQGPSAVAALQPLVDPELVDLSQLDFMMAIDHVTIGGIPNCCIGRSGYSGEDGFEISIPTKNGVNHIASLLIDTPGSDVKLGGLAAMGALRIEAGLCWYGLDIDETTSPIEAGLGWTISKRRRIEGRFPGASIIMEQIQNGVPRKRVGFTIQSKTAPSRHDYKVYSGSEVVGKTTSCCFSVILGCALSMGYVAIQHAVPGTELVIDIDGVMTRATVTKLPFVPSHHYTSPRTSILLST